MMINHVQEKIIGGDFFKMWVVPLHYFVPLGECKGTVGTVFFNITEGNTSLAGFNLLRLAMYHSLMEWLLCTVIYFPIIPINLNYQIRT
ncbi:hypothetical protein FG459_003562 [Yersinia enterocolitica]|nr:hypothetical protein [Yersinia enterocolitica]